MMVLKIVQASDNFTCCSVASVPKDATLHIFPVAALAGLRSPVPQGNTKTSASTTNTIKAPQRPDTLSVATSQSQWGTVTP